jgi:TPP-dependent pyruvate/acetoin dehydrogenase alpha subunit
MKIEEHLTAASGRALAAPAAPDTLTEHYRIMCRIRMFEEKIIDLKLAGLVAGSVHPCNGQEAISVGAVSVLDLRCDVVFATYRGHGWAIACGSELPGLFGELLGRSTGVNGGRGGSAYLSDPARGFYGENSIVGGGVPHAVGAGLASRYDGSGRVSLAVCGDGALNQGAVHEAMNMAGAMRLPVVFLIESNRYSELTPTATMVGNRNLFERATGYGFPGLRIDGNDSIAVADAVAWATERARDDLGPTLLEAMTERLTGHYVGDPEHYRPAGEVAAAAVREPLVVARRQLADAGVDAASLDEIVAGERALIEVSAVEALAAPVADPATVLEWLYAS